MRFNYILKWILVSVAVVFLTACGGGGDTPPVDDGSKTNASEEVIKESNISNEVGESNFTEENISSDIENNVSESNFTEESNQNSIKGIAQLGYISGGDVKLYELSDLTNPIATTKTSTSTNVETAGSFIFQNLVLDSNKYYLVEISGGKDIDINDDGIIDTNDTLDLNGDVHALVMGDMLQNIVRINAFSDMAYMKLKGSLSTLNNTQITSELEKTAKEYLYDVNGDEKIDYKDILDFNPTKDRDKTKNSYKDILDIYIPKLHYNDREEKKLSALMYLDNPRIIIENGNLQEVPFTLKANIENMPKSVTIKWFIDNSEKSSINEVISKDGIYQISARLYKGDELLKTISSSMIATIKTEIASVLATINENSEISVTIDSNSSLSGTQILIPKGALKEDTKITIKKSSINSIPTSGGIGISDVLVMEPSGLTFDKPIQIRMPYDENVDLTDKTVRIARYSEGGVVDYISPLYIDKEHHEIVFETEHFTEFKAETEWGILERKLDINKDNQPIIKEIEDFTKLSYTVEEWIKLLNISIYDKYRVYDYVLTAMKNDKIYTLINDISSKSSKYAFAYYELYGENTHAHTVWNDTKSALTKLEAISGGIQSAITMIEGKKLKATLEAYGALTGTNIPTEWSSVSLYDPIQIGDELIGKGLAIVEGEHIEKYFNCHNDFYEKFTCDKNKEKLKSLKMFSSTKSLYERFKAREKYSQKNDTIELVKLYKNKIDNPDINYKKESNFIGNNSQFTQLLIGEINSKISINIEIETVNYDSFTPIFYLYKKDIGKLITTFNPTNFTFNKNLYTTTLDIQTPSLKGNYEYYITYDNVNKIKFKIDVKEPKKEVTILNMNFTGNLSADGESYSGLIDAKFDINPSLPYEVILYYKGENIGKSFKINKADFEDNVLSNLTATVHISDETKNTYSIDDKEFTLDIKAKIAEALKSREDNTEQIVEMIPELVADTDRYIQEGNSVTFSLDKKYIDSILSRSFSSSYINTVDEGDKYRFTATYNTKGVYTPSIKLKLKSGNIVYIDVPIVHVSAVEVIPTLPAPTNLVAASTTDSITLNWDEVTDALFYTVCMSETTISDGNKCVENGGILISGGTGIEKIITDILTSNTTYYFRVKGFKSDYTALWSDEVTKSLKISYPTLTVNAGEDKTAIFGDNLHLISAVEGTIDGLNINYSWVENGIELSNNSYLLKGDWEVGEHNITLIVRDEYNREALDDVVVTVNPISITNILPIANAGADKVITYQENAYLSGANSSDSDGFIISYKWYENGLLLGENENLSLASLSEGTHTVTLIVTDNDDMNGTDEVVVTVNENITEPQVIGTTGDIGLNPRQMKVLNGFAYVAAEIGLVIIDVRNPTNPKVISTLTGLADVAHIDIEGDYAYLATFTGWGTSAPGLRIVDISDPFNPFLVSFLEGSEYSSDLSIYNNYLYIEGDGPDGISIIDITNKNSPKLIKNITSFGQYFYTAKVIDNYLYVTSQYEFKIINITVPDSPVLVGTFKINNSISDNNSIEGIDIRGDFAYIGTTENIQIINISNKSNPTLTYTLNDYYTYGMKRIIRVVNDHLYLGSGMGGGMEIINISNPNSPYQTNYFQVDAVGYGDDSIQIEGNYLYSVSSEFQVSYIGMYK